jgi:hypothetical protein
MATHETFFTELGKRTCYPNSKPKKALGGEPAPKLVPWLKKNLKIHLNYLQILQMSPPPNNLVPLTRLIQSL